MTPQPDAPISLHAAMATPWQHLSRPGNGSAPQVRSV